MMDIYSDKKKCKNLHNERERERERERKKMMMPGETRGRNEEGCE